MIAIGNENVRAARLATPTMMSSHTNRSLQIGLRTTDAVSNSISGSRLLTSSAAICTIEKDGQIQSSTSAVSFDQIHENAPAATNAATGAATDRATCASPRSTRNSHSPHTTAANARLSTIRLSRPVGSETKFAQVASTITTSTERVNMVSFMLHQ